MRRITVLAQTAVRTHHFLLDTQYVYVVTIIAIRFTCKIGQPPRNHKFDNDNTNIKHIINMTMPVSYQIIFISDNCNAKDSGRLKNKLAASTRSEDRLRNLAQEPSHILTLRE